MVKPSHFHCPKAALCLLIVCFLPARYSATAQDFVSSTLWQNPAITVSPEDRVKIARDGIERTIVMLGTNGQFNDSFYGTPARLFSQMAEFDLATNQTTYKDQLLQYFQQAQGVQTGFLNEFSCHEFSVFTYRTCLQINYGLAYGIAAARAYAAYRDPAFMDFAQTAWKSGSEYTLSQDVLQAGKISGKNLTLRKACTLNSMVGGSFWRRDPNSLDLNSLSTGSFLVTSALLAEATNASAYQDAAIQAADFISNHLMNFQGVIQDSIDASTCTPSAEPAHSYNAGLTLEGLAVLSSVTRNATISQRLRNLILDTVSSNAWQDNDGIIENGGSELGGQYVVRGLAAVYNRNSTPSDLRNYIKDYIGVQYNAVLKNATEQGSSVYGASWKGPPPSAFSSEAQTNALSVLIAAIPLRNDTFPSGGSVGPDGPPKFDDPPVPKKPLNVGAIKTTWTSIYQ
uniref:Glycoside hydrolase family 76 protein n=1 Tax=Moniliophthora roreri TaxID=221103 RepID=A0A0W0GEH2_MONRR